MSLKASLFRVSLLLVADVSNPERYIAYIFATSKKVVHGSGVLAWVG